MPSRTLNINLARSSGGRLFVIGLSFYCLDAAAKDRLDDDHPLGDELLEFRIIGGKFRHRVDQHAATALLLADQLLDDLVEERPDRGGRRSAGRLPRSRTRWAR
jgi:hypothetical protein